MKREKYKIEAGEDPEQMIRFLEDRIYEHNSSAINTSDGELFSRIVRGEDKEIIAGVAGWAWGSACEITQLWVKENVRSSGIGKLLLESVEIEAKAKGCLIILVKSYSFQAPQFYKAHGYQIEHVQYGFPPGHNYYILTKRIG